MGYFMKFESRLERYDGLLLYTGILFLINLVLFAIFCVVYINDPTDIMMIGTILPDLMIIAAFDFHTLGNLLGEIRGVS